MSVSRSKLGKPFWGLLTVLILAVALLVRVSAMKRVAEEGWNELYELSMHPRAGIYVPVYEAETTAGDTVRLGDVAPGQRQVLLFFTTSCPYCRASVPSWKALARRIETRAGVTVVAVALDSMDLAREYEEEHELTYPVALMDSPRFGRLFRVSGVPLTMVVEPDGRVAYAHRGEFSDPALSDSVNAILDQPTRDAGARALNVPSVRETPVPR